MDVLVCRFPVRKQRFRNQMSTGPTELQVESSRYAIHVEYFAREIETGHDTGLSRFWIDFARVDSSSRNEFFSRPTARVREF